MNIEENIIEFKKMIERDKDTLRYWKSDTFGHYDEPIKKLEKDVLISEALLIAYEKEKEKNKSIVYNYEMVVDKLENSTPNDKIKAKIEEVEQWELYNMKIPRLSTLDERLGAKIGIKYVLQSLLEKK